MQATIPAEDIIVPQSLDDPPTFNTVVVYDDVHAGQRAMTTLVALTAEFDDGRFEARPQLWRFDLLEDRDWFALALADAINAHMLVLSTSRTSGLPVAVENWLRLCLARKRGTRTAVVALLGPDGNPDRPASPRFQFIQSAVRGAGLDFFAPVPSA